MGPWSPANLDPVMVRAAADVAEREGKSVLARNLRKLASAAEEARTVIVIQLPDRSKEAP